jgi:signal transduction histidine kinase
VTDNGRGILAREQKKIFTPGYTTKKRGWGLGLSLTKRIVEEYHRGKITLVESIPNQKTTFLVSLPLKSKRG